MKLFFKHLIRSIRKRPLQPVVILLSLMLSVTVSLVAFVVGDSLAEESLIATEQSYGIADVTVTLNSNVKSRFMIAEWAEELLGEGAVAVGALDVAMTLGDGDGVFGAAVNFSEVSSIFNFDFVEYSEITTDNLGKTVLISKALASEKGLSVGDTVSLTLFGVKNDYTVRGVSLYPYMSGYDILIDTGSAVKALSHSSTLASALRDDFEPSNCLYVLFADGMTVEEGVNILLSSPDFADKTIVDVATSAATEAALANLLTVLNFVIIFAAVLSAVTTFSGLYVLSSLRSEENEIFASAGAKPRMLYLMQYTEAVLYWFFASLLGILLALPILDMLYRYGGYNYAYPSLSVVSVLKSSALILLVTLFSVTLTILAKKRKRKAQVSDAFKKILLSVTFAVTAVLFLFCFLLSSGAKMKVGTVGFIAFMLLLSLILPMAVRLTALRLSSLTEKRSPSRTSVTYALKNIYSVRILHNVTRLISVIVVIGLCTASVITSSVGYSKDASKIFSADYLVLNASERAYERIEQCPSAMRVDDVFFGAGAQGDGTACFIISVNESATLSDKLGIDRLPKEDEVVISRAQAKLLSVGIGDTYVVSIEGKTIELRVSEIVRYGQMIAVFDVEHFGIKSNMTAVKAGEGIAPDSLLDELSAATAGEMVSIATVNDLFNARMHYLNICRNAGTMLMFLILIYSLIGIFDSLYDSYRSRRDEFSLYRFSGMSDSKIRRMKCAELLFTFIFGIVIGIIGYIVSALLLAEALCGLGFDIFYNMYSAV